MHVVGQMFVSNNYICFASREEDLCQLIIPLREVSAFTITVRADWFTDNKDSNRNPNSSPYTIKPQITKFVKYK